MGTIGHDEGMMNVLYILAFVAGGAIAIYQAWKQHKKRCANIMAQYESLRKMLD